MGCTQSCLSPSNQTPNEGQRCCRTLRCCGSMPIQPEKRCKITGCTFLDNGYLVIVDSNNKRVKLYSPQLKCCSFITLDYRPYDLCADGNSLYVTMPRKRLVKKMTVTMPLLFVKRKLTQGASFPTEGECKAISSCRGDLILCLKFSTHANTEITDSAWQIQIVSTKGVVKRRITHDAEGIALIQDVKYMCLTPNKKEIVITEAEDNRVKCLDLERGELTFNHHMEDPKGVICDNMGNIYVLGKHGAIRWILYDRSIVKALLQGTSGVNYSETIAYCKLTNTLAVPRNKNKVDLYTLKKSIHDG